MQIKVNKKAYGHQVLITTKDSKLEAILWKGEDNSAVVDELINAAIAIMPEGYNVAKMIDKLKNR